MIGRMIAAPKDLQILSGVVFNSFPVTLKVVLICLLTNNSKSSCAKYSKNYFKDDSSRLPRSCYPIQLIFPELDGCLASVFHLLYILSFCVFVWHFAVLMHWLRVVNYSICCSALFFFNILIKSRVHNRISRNIGINVGLQLHHQYRYWNQRVLY